MSDDYTYRIDVDASGAVRGAREAADALEDVQAAADGLDGASVELDVEADTRDAIRDVSELADQVDDLDGTTADVEVDADASQAIDELDQVTTDLDDIDGTTATAELDVDTDRSSADVAALQDELDNFDQQEFIAEMLVEVDQARAEILDLREQLVELEDFDLPDLQLRVETDLADAEQRLAGLEQDLDDLGVPRSIEIDSEPVQQATTRMSGLATAVGNVPVVGTDLRNVVQSVDAIGRSARTATGAVAGFLAGFGVIGLITTGISAVRSAMDFFGRSSREAAERAEELQKAIRGINDALEAGNTAKAAEQFVDQFKDLIDGAAEFGASAGEVERFVRGLSDEIVGLTDVADPFGNDMEKMGFALVAARERFAEQREEVARTGAQYDDVADSMGGMADAQRDVAASTDEWTQMINDAVAPGLEEQRLRTEQAAAAVAAYQQVVSSADWGEAALQGATTAMAGYTAELFAAPNAAIAAALAQEQLAEAVDEGGFSLDANTEAGRRNLQALQAVSTVLEGEFAQAYADAGGDMEVFQARADEIGRFTLAALSDQLGLSAEEALLLAQQLGLTEGDYQARFELAGAEEAFLKLQLLQTAINDLPEDVQTDVTQRIIEGDYEGALAIVQAFYDAHPAVVTSELDMSEPRIEMTRFTGEDHRTTITGDGDNDPARSNMEDFIRTDWRTTITGDGDNTPARTDIDSFTGTDWRTTITGNAEVGQAERDINYAARTREAVINVVSRISSFVTSPFGGSSSGGGSSTQGFSGGGEELSMLAARASDDDGFGTMDAFATAADADPVGALFARSFRPVVVPQPQEINVRVEAAVIGSQTEVTRQVADAVQQGVRLAGRRQMLIEGAIR